MSNSEEEFANIINLCANAKLINETGKQVIYLPEMRFGVSGNTVTQDLLFVPWAHSGYETRLFFTAVIPGKGSNWTQHNLLNRGWHAPSYRVDKCISWRNQILQHIKAVA